MTTTDDALFAIAEGLDNVASAIRALGNADAATPMGAIENLAKQINDGLDRIASSIEAKGE